MDHETVKDIIETSKAEILIASLASWQKHRYSMFKSDYLIIMDSIVDPNIDLKLGKTKE